MGGVNRPRPAATTITLPPHSSTLPGFQTLPLSIGIVSLGHAIQNASHCIPAFSKPTNTYNTSTRKQQRHACHHLFRSTLTPPAILPAQQFQVLFTALSRCFSTFLHSTFSLSVLTQYLVLGALYLLLYAALSSNATRIQFYTTHIHGHTGLSPSAVVRSSTLGPFGGHQRKGQRRHRLSPSTPGLWVFHSPLLDPSQLFSFPSASDMLKFTE